MLWSRAGRRRGPPRGFLGGLPRGAARGAGGPRARRGDGRRGGVSRPRLLSGGQTSLEAHLCLDLFSLRHPDTQRRWRRLAQCELPELHVSRALAVPVVGWSVRTREGGILAVDCDCPQRCSLRVQKMPCGAVAAKSVAAATQLRAPRPLQNPGAQTSPRLLRSRSQGSCKLSEFVFLLYHIFEYF